MNKSTDKKSVKKPAANLYVFDEDFYPGKLKVFEFLKKLICQSEITLDIWKDDAKMSVYLNTFRPRQVNEEHYDQKMSFWKEMIENYCEYKGCSKVTIQELKTAFRRKGTSPYCLQDVFNQMVSEGKLENKEQFMQQPKSIAGWAVNSLLVKPLSWGFGKLKEQIVSTSPDEQGEFVVKSALVNQSKYLLDHVRSLGLYNNIISMDELMSSEVDGVAKDGILLVLQYLSTVEKKVYMEEEKSESDLSNHHKLLLKFAEHHKIVSPITDIERSVYNLEKTEKFLLNTIDKKEQHLNDILKQIKDCVREGKKQMAKTLLRKKHMLEADIIKTMNVLENVQTMGSRVHSSKSDKEIISTYKMGSEAIKKAFAESGINLDSVDDVIENMREVYADQEEFEHAISEPMRGNNYIDDSELEKELNELMEPTKDDKTNNAGGNITEKKPQAMDQLDQELEMRLRRLRSDFTVLDDPDVSRPGLSQRAPLN